MKRVRFFSAKAALMIAIVVFLSPSCKKADNVTTTAADNDRITFLKQAIANSTGMPLDKVVYGNNEKLFMIDGDSYITLDDATARFAGNGTGAPGSANGTSQMIGYYRVSSSKVNTIKIYADATVPSMWVKALDSAIKNWNATGSRVYMQRVTSSTGAATQVVTYYSVSTTIAIAAYPDMTGNPGTRIKINTYQNSLPNLKKIFALTHELGHTLGFSHTNGTFGYLISGTPAYDAYSVMNASCMNWSGFSVYDRKAVVTVYPK